MIFVMKLRPHQGRCSPMIILLCNLLRWNLSKCSQFVKFVLPIIKKSEKREVTKAVPRYLQFCVIFLCLKFDPMNCFYQQALGRAQICLMVRQIFGNSICGNVINLAQKIPILFVAKHYEMEKNFAKICIGRLLAMFPTVFCFRFFRRIESLYSHPDLARSKKPYGASWNVKIKNSRNWSRHVRSSIFLGGD